MKGLFYVIDRGTVEHVQGNCGLFTKAITAQMTGVFEGSRAPANESLQRVNGRSDPALPQPWMDKRRLWTCSPKCRLICSFTVQKRLYLTDRQCQLKPALAIAQQSSISAAAGLLHLTLSAIGQMAIAALTISVIVALPLPAPQQQRSALGQP